MESENLSHRDDNAETRMGLFSFFYYYLILFIYFVCLFAEKSLYKNALLLVALTMAIEMCLG